MKKYMKMDEKGNRINRYIVGCKYDTATLTSELLFRINRYIVGCKYVITGCRFFSVIRINRYIVGCKLRRLTPKQIGNAELIDT